jgi:predicted SnoaL-like aldol condensation-catalyzing enzyme
MSVKDVVAEAINAVYTTRDRGEITRHFTPALRQHGSVTADGLEGLLAYAATLPDGIHYEQHRVFAEGDLVVTHGTYTGLADTPLVAFDLWRVDDGCIVEHWDGMEPRVSTTVNGHTQTDGPATSDPAADTAANKAHVEATVETILVENDFRTLDRYLAGENYIQHNPRFADGVSGLAAALRALAELGQTMQYSQRYYTLAEGDFVYTLSDGHFAGTPYAFHDLFRVADDLAVEHWDVMVEQSGTLPHHNGLF